MTTAQRPSSLWRHRDFMHLWGGQAVSEVGSQVTFIALPLLAVITLHATTFEAALLEAAGSAAFLLIALQAGSLVDRWRKKRIMVWSDLLRGVLLASVPVAHLAGILTLAQLYVVALLISVLTVFFDVAYQAYLPMLVADDQLVDGNAKIGGSQSFAQVAGPSVGGALVGAVGAAYAVAVDVVSFAVSAVLTGRVRDPEPAPEPRPAGARLRTEIRAGLAFVFGHRVLRKVLGCTATHNFFANMTGALDVVFLVRVLGASGRTVGFVFALGALGGLAGAALARRLATRVGTARIVWVSVLVEAPFLFARPFAFSGWGVLLVSLTGAGMAAASVVYNVAQVSYRQAVTPRHLLGRMTASARFVVWGVSPLGAVAGGALGTLLGIRTTLFIAAVGGSLSVLWVLASPLARVRDVADLPPELGGTAAVAAS
ncbi:MAG TPA: MFS transporter [Mycobacteriales bacterium]|nr:MFS transporter [Mycobacteriales bacterium]